MAGEFVKSTTIKPAIIGTIANPDEYNQNIAGQSKDSIIAIDVDGNFIDGDIGDESLGVNGTLVNDIKLRQGGNLKFYNASGVFQNDVNLGQATESLIGQAELATQIEVDAGTDDLKIITPLKNKDAVTSCKAWVTFRGYGTVTILDSYNVTSITDHGPGDWTINFTNAFSNTNYSNACSSYQAAGNSPVTIGRNGNRSITTSSFPAVATQNTSRLDLGRISFLFFGN